MIFFINSPQWIISKLFIMIFSICISAIGLGFHLNFDTQWYWILLSLTSAIIPIAVILIDIIIIKTVKQKPSISESGIAMHLSQIEEKLDDCETINSEISKLRNKATLMREQLANLSKENDILRIKLSMLENMKQKHKSSKRNQQNYQHQISNLQKTIDLAKMLVENQSQSISIIDSILTNLIENGYNIKDFEIPIAQSLTAITNTTHNLRQLIKGEKKISHPSSPRFAEYINKSKE